MDVQRLIYYRELLADMKTSERILTDDEMCELQDFFSDEVERRTDIDSEVRYG